MGLKIRRLKKGYAFYAEYKFGRHTVYESIKASSVREARRLYAVRYEQLRGSVTPGEQPVTLRAARDSQIGAVFAELLHTLVAKRVLSDTEAEKLAHKAFARHGTNGPATASAAMPRELMEEFAALHDLQAAASEIVGPIGDAQPALVPSET